VRAAADFEDLVGFVDEELVFVIGKVAVDVELFKFGGGRFGEGVAVFLKGKSFAGEAGEGINEAGEFFRLARRISFGGCSEAHQLVEHLGGSDAEAGLVKVGGIRGGEDVGGELGFRRDPFEPVAFEEPILVAEFFPFLEVVWIEVLAVLAEPLNDFGIGDAIQYPVVDLFAEGFGQAGDFAVATAAAENF
jgi:hypothetical protein